MLLRHEINGEKRQEEKRREGEGRTIGKEKMRGERERDVIFIVTLYIYIYI